jgi:hypothetical protein
MFNRRDSVCDARKWAIGGEMMFRIAALLLLFPVLAAADPEPWMKKNNPEELFYNVAVDDDCPLSENSLNSVVGGVLTRSRIKVKDGFEEGELVLTVNLACVDDGEVDIFDVTIRFDRLSIRGDELIACHVFSDYGTFGQGRRDFIQTSVKEGVENALTDYLRANFDLGGDD